MEKNPKPYILVYSEDENFQAISWGLICKYGGGTHTFNAQ